MIEIIYMSKRDLRKSLGHVNKNLKCDIKTIVCEARNVHVFLDILEMTVNRKDKIFNFTLRYSNDNLLMRICNYY